jgi:uncharacterized Zn finger protein
VVLPDVGEIALKGDEIELRLEPIRKFAVALAKNKSSASIRVADIPTIWLGFAKLRCTK